MRKSGLIYPFLLLACWTGLIGAGTYALLETTIRQHLARGFSATQGRIVRSEVGHSVMIRRGIEIEYHYIVSGKAYTGHRFRYDDHNSALEWEVAVEGHPLGSSQTVYYNPKNPADALLQPGVDGCDLLLLLFALVIGVLTSVLWRALLTRLRERSGIRPAGGVRILKLSGMTTVPLGETSAFTAGFYAMAAAAFIAAFPIVIVGGFEPSLRLVQTSWEVVLGAGVPVFMWRVMKKWSGIYDLRIDQASQTVTLPQTAGRRQPVSISRREICGVSMQRRVSKSPSGTHFSYLPALNRDGLQTDSQSIKLISWGWSEEKARAFSQWLSQELGVEFKGVEEEPSDFAAKS